MNDRIDRRRLDDTESVFSQAIDRYGLEHDSSALMHLGTIDDDEDEDEDEDEIDRLISKLKPAAKSSTESAPTVEKRELTNLTTQDSSTIIDQSKSESDSESEKHNAADDNFDAGADSEADADAEDEADADSDNGGQKVDVHERSEITEKKTEKLSVYERKMLKKLKLKGTAADIQLVRERAIGKQALKPAVTAAKSASQPETASDLPKAKK